MTSVCLLQRVYRKAAKCCCKTSISIGQVINTTQVNSPTNRSTHSDAKCTDVSNRSQQWRIYFSRDTSQIMCLTDYCKSKTKWQFQQTGSCSKTLSYQPGEHMVSCCFCINQKLELLLYTCTLYIYSTIVLMMYSYIQMSILVNTHLHIIHVYTGTCLNNDACAFKYRWWMWMWRWMWCITKVHWECLCSSIKKETMCLNFLYYD